MFKNKLTYYHGTTDKNWAKIQREGKIKPNNVKSIGSYWITKGAYFVCENPLIALWYAHISCHFDKSPIKSTPVVLCIEYEADSSGTGEIVNLLTSNGHRLLSYAHRKFKEKLSNRLSSDETDALQNKNYNLDSKALQLLLDKSTILKGIIASFQEGESFQKIIHNKNYENKYVPFQHGICPGDHVEICFYPHFELNENVGIRALKKEDLIDEDNMHIPIWPHVCMSLNNALTSKGLRKGFNDYLKKEYPGIEIGGSE